MVKKFITLGVLLVMVFLFGACTDPDSGLEVYKDEAKVNRKFIRMFAAFTDSY